jgi:hypothetical protein
VNVVVVVPSRGRPAAAGETIRAIRDTAVRVNTRIVLAVDEDDPCLLDYRRLVTHSGKYAPEVWMVTLAAEETGNLVRATNTVSMRVAAADPHAIIGNLGDDHRPRTPGWDRRIIEALEEPGIAYGDDKIQGEKLPTAPFISARIVTALGWYALPTCEHMFIDDAWREVGAALGRLRYLPEVIIEHMHPAVGKGEWDDSYRRVNSDAAIARDRLAFVDWRGGPMFHADIANVQRALEAQA